MTLLQKVYCLGLIIVGGWHHVISFSPPGISSNSRLLTRHGDHQSNHERSFSSATVFQVAASSSTFSTSDISSKPMRNDVYLRWNKEGDTWKMQTAVTTFQRGNQTVDLHAQLHFGDKEYFDYWNAPEFVKDLDKVYYELLVDQDLLEYHDGEWKLNKAIMASPNDQSMARQYGWECQASTVDYTQPKWIHADLSRQELLKLADKEEKDKRSSSHQQPLWKVASSSGPQSSSAAAEAVSAFLVGPPTLSYSTPILKRRLFTNLFLPGDSFANVLRGVLWMTVPSPELSIILLDWSSLLQGKGNINALSQVALPILSSLVKLDVSQIRRFLFGQVLITSNTAPRQQQRQQDDDQSLSAWSLLVTQRNDRALQVLKNGLEEATTGKSTDATKKALLYGSSHCPDLHAKLMDMGFSPTQTTWRTAWSVQERKEETILPALVAALLLYLVVGALDWVSMMGDVSQGWVDGNFVDSTAAGGLYLLRHVLLYLGLSKFLVDWTNSNNDE